MYSNSNNLVFNFFSFHKDLISEKTLNYLMLNNENLDFSYDIKSNQICLKLKKEDYFLDENLIVPSKYEDGLYSIDDEYTMLLFEAYFNRKYLFSDYNLQLEHPLWRIRRDEIVNKYNGKCNSCKSSKSLNVHHKKYIQDRLAWEYEDDILECLCSTCHKSLHKEKESTKKNNISLENAKEILNVKLDILEYFNDDVLNYLVLNSNVVRFDKNLISFSLESYSIRKHLSNNKTKFFHVNQNNLTINYDTMYRTIKNKENRQV